MKAMKDSRVARTNVIRGMARVVLWLFSEDYFNDFMLRQEVNLCLGFVLVLSGESNALAKIQFVQWSIR